MKYFTQLSFHRVRECAGLMGRHATPPSPSAPPAAWPWHGSVASPLSREKEHRRCQKAVLSDPGSWYEASKQWLSTLAAQSVTWEAITNCRCLSFIQAYLKTRQVILMFSQSGEHWSGVLNTGEEVAPTTAALVRWRPQIAWEGQLAREGDGLGARQSVLPGGVSSMLSFCRAGSMKEAVATTG